jgi:hypothetical protein
VDFVIDLVSVYEQRGVGVFAPPRLSAVRNGLIWQCQGVINIVGNFFLNQSLPCILIIAETINFLLLSLKFLPVFPDFCLEVLIAVDE